MSNVLLKRLPQGSRELAARKLASIVESMVTVNDQDAELSPPFFLEEFEAAHKW